MTATAASDPVVTVAALQREISSGRAPLLLDVRWSLAGPPGREAYDRGHLPGARFVDLDRHLCAPPGVGGRHPLPSVTALESTMRRLGVRADSDVVCYDQSDGAAAAARCWWTLRYLGHRRVRVLDGGFDGWVAAGGEVSTHPNDAEAAGDFRAAPATLPVLDADGAARAAHSGLLLDVRAEQRYRGEMEPIDPVAGHIPGAVNVPVAGYLQDGRLRSAHELARAFADLGAPGGTEVGVYCGSGVAAAHAVLALERAGVDAALYVGSWSDWITDPLRPVATDTR